MQTCFKEFYDFHPMQFQVRGPGRTWDGELQRDDVKMGKKRFAEKWEKVQKNMDWLIDELFSFANFFSGTLGPFWALWQRCDSVWVSRGQLWVQICSKWISAFFFLPQNFELHLFFPKSLVKFLKFISVQIFGRDGNMIFFVAMPSSLEKAHRLCAWVDESLTVACESIASNTQQWKPITWVLVRIFLRLG